MTPEGAVKNAVKKLLDEHSAYYFMPVSNGMGRHGIPDIIVCHYGHFIGIECKAKGGKPTALQERELRSIRTSGGYSLVVDDTPETMEQLIWLLNNLAKPS